MMKLNLKSLFVVLFALVFKTGFAQTTQADSLSVPHAYWVAGYLGCSFSGSLQIMGTANAEIGNRWLLTGVGQAEARLFGTGDDMTTFGLLAGKIYKHHKTAMLCVSAGLAATQVYSKNTIGIPILIQANNVLLQTVGACISFYANLNTIKPSAGIGLGIGLGRMATHR